MIAAATANTIAVSDVRSASLDSKVNELPLTVTPCASHYESIKTHANGDIVEAAGAATPFWRGAGEARPDQNGVVKAAYTI
jgi:hypothetical protein